MGSAKLMCATEPFSKKDEDASARAIEAMIGNSRSRGGRASYSGRLTALSEYDALDAQQFNARKSFAESSAQEARCVPRRGV